MLPVSAIAAAISANAVQTAPAGLAICAAAATVKGTAVAASTLVLIQTTLKHLAWTRLKSAMAIGVAVLLMTGATTLIVRKSFTPSLEDTFANVDSRSLGKAPPMLVLRETRFPNSGRRGVITDQRLMIRDMSLGELLSTAYDFRSKRIVLPPDAPKGAFDLLLTLPNRPMEALREEIKRQFGLVARRETRDADVLVLTIANVAAPKLLRSQGQNGSVDAMKGKVVLRNEPLSNLANYLETELQRILIDRTGLAERYDIKLEWEPQAGDDANAEAIRHALLDQAGIDLIPAREPVEMLIVEKVSPTDTERRGTR